MAPLPHAAKYDPFLSLDCAPKPSTLAQSKERKGSNFAIWQPCNQTRLHSDYTYFYVGIALCALLAALILALNLALGCCSPWRKYWTNRDSGNREAIL